MVERGERLDAGGDQLVHQPVVEVEALRVRLPVPSGKMRGQAIENRYAFAPSVLHQPHVFLVAVVVVVGDVAGVAVPDLARRVRVRVPDRRAFAVLVPCALDLVGRGGRAPEKPFGNSRVAGDAPGAAAAAAAALAAVWG